MEFERENDVMDQRQELMDDAIDDAFEDDEEETDQVVNQVLDEIGIDLSQSLTETPSALANKSAATEKIPQALGVGAGDDDLQARLDSLKR